MIPRERTGLILELIAAVNATAVGSTTRVSVSTPEQVAVVQEWCRTSGNTVFAVHADGVDIYRGTLDDTAATIPAEQMPGHRLWLYTNFHCNLACDYCCVASSPHADPRLLSAVAVSKLVSMGVANGVAELYLTGGEPFLNPEITAIVATCVQAAPTVMLTNGMLLQGRRLKWLDAMPRDGLVLQISVDSATPDVHDEHRGEGSWQRATKGVATARQMGFQVRFAATLAEDNGADAHDLADLAERLGVPADDMIVRNVAHQGVATSGISISRATVVPEVCVTSAGIYWHPVAAADPAMLVEPDLGRLPAAIAEIREEFLEHRRRGDALAATFPCA